MYKHVVLLMLLLAPQTLANEPAKEEEIVDGSSDGRVKVITTESKSYILEKIDKLEKSLDKLEQYSYNKQNANPSAKDDASANILVQVEELHQNVKELRGNIESLEHKLDELNQKIINNIADMEYKFSEMQKQLKQRGHEGKVLNSIDKQLDENVFSNKLADQNALQKESSPFGKMTANSEQKPTNPEEQYQKAYAFIKDKNYPLAQKALQEFIAQNQSNQLVGNAYYWLGEIEFSQNNIEDAAVHYLRGYQNAPSGSKASDNLLKLGVSLKKLDKRKEACITFTKLDKEFPEMSTIIRKRLTAEMKELACE